MPRVYTYSTEKNIAWNFLQFVHCHSFVYIVEGGGAKGADAGWKKHLKMACSCSTEQEHLLSRSVVKRRIFQTLRGSIKKFLLVTVFMQFSEITTV